MNSKAIVDFVLGKNITQQDLGNYLQITRQTVAKISNGEYVKLNSESQYKLDKLNNRSIEEIKKILKLDQYINDIRNRILEGNEKYIDYAYEGFKYMHYWVIDDKFKQQDKYHEFYYGHMNNFYPRFNQAALFMRDTLNRQKYPLVTYQIDYNKKQITDMCIKAFTKENDRVDFDTKSLEFPITFQNFLEMLEARIKPSPRFLIYRDYLDDDWKFIIDNVKEQWVHKQEIYDLSRLLNFFENQQPYFGPLIENALKQFKIDFDVDRLLIDCHYRAEKIVELINLISLEDLHRQKYDKSAMMFDSHGFKRNNNYVQEERRKLKRKG